MVAALTLGVAGALGPRRLHHRRRRRISAAHPPAGSPHDVVLASVTKTGHDLGPPDAVDHDLGLTVARVGHPAPPARQARQRVARRVGDFDFATKSGQMTMTVPPIGGGSGTRRWSSESSTRPST